MIDLRRLRVVMFVALLTPVSGLTSSVQAQQGWPPDSTENLKVLPADIPIRDLIATMRGFAGALGVRCIHCHVGDDPSDLSSVDFVSDEKIEKRKARAMIQMLATINTELLATVPERSDPAVEIKCSTCHRGLTKPADIADILDAKMAEGGADAAIAEYEALREEYYGSWTYNFTEFTLTSVAEEAVGADPDGAMQILDYNLTHYPESSYTYVMKAQVYSNLHGDFDAAIDELRNAQRVDPDQQPRIQRMIDQLEQAAAQDPDGDR
jgi:tetratricopeptide (TPR) repeat protein